MQKGWRIYFYSCKSNIKKKTQAVSKQGIIRDYIPKSNRTIFVPQLLTDRSTITYTTTLELYTKGKFT